MTAEFLAALDAAPRDAMLDAASLAGSTAATVIIGLVSMKLVGPLARTPPLPGDRRHGVEQRLERHAVVDVCRGQQEGERDALPVREDVALGAGTAPVGRIRACCGAPLFAAMDALSMQARLQSMRSASRNRRSSSTCRRSHTPAVCQSRRRRQQVTPEPQPISRGSISHGMPVRSTNTMPARAARSGTRGRPPFGFSATGGRSGSITDQRVSDTSGAGIPPHESIHVRVQEF